MALLRTPFAILHPRLDVTGAGPTAFQTAAGEWTIEHLLPRFDEDGNWLSDPANWTDTGDTILERRDSCEMVRRCIEKLPVSYRSVLLMRDIEELDTEQTAHVMAVTATTVKVRLHRARQALKTLIERDLALQPNESGRSRSCERHPWVLDAMDRDAVRALGWIGSRSLCGIMRNWQYFSRSLSVTG